MADFTLYACCKEAANCVGAVAHEGICHSQSFYHEENEQESAYWSQKGVLGADMETAALFTIGRLRGMKTASILNNVVSTARIPQTPLAITQAARAPRQEASGWKFSRHWRPFHFWKRGTA